MRQPSFSRPLGSAIAAMAVLVVATACAGGALRLGAEDVPRLEQATAAAPRDAELISQLGVAYYNAGRYEEARDALRRAIDAGARTGATHLYLGLANEELGDWTGARTAYSRYLASGETGRMRSRIRQRLSLVGRHELRQQAALALEQEAQLSTEPPTPRSVAVFPFELTGATPELRPLQAALADMIITDLGLTGRLISIERARVNTLLDEMVLAQAGFTEPATGARAGRLLRAEHVVQGVLDLSIPERLRIDAAVLNTERRASIGAVEQQGALEALFALEKQLVFSIYEQLGIELTPAERERINENRTDNLVAFLLYGEGLEALDRGDYEHAAQLFTQANALDPGFRAARSQQGAAAGLEAAAAVTSTEMAAAAAEEFGAVVVEAPLSGGTTLLTQMTNEVNQSAATLLTAGQQTQSAAAPLSDTQAPGPNPSPVAPQSATITITIPRPGS